MSRDHYEVLGISRQATDDDIKRAYRDLARRYHPDSHPDDPEAEERFKEASEAYAVLSDADKRRAYDRFGFEGLVEPLYVGGVSRLAAEQEAFETTERAARLFEVLEHQVLVVSLVRELLDRGLTVSIGSENRLDDLRDCAIVLAPYQVGDRPAGIVGVLGPTRMNYRHALAAVSAVSDQLGRHLS